MKFAKRGYGAAAQDSRSVCKENINSFKPPGLTDIGGFGSHQLGASGDHKPGSKSGELASCSILMFAHEEIEQKAKFENGNKATLSHS